MTEIQKAIVWAEFKPLMTSFLPKNGRNLTMITSIQKQLFKKIQVKTKLLLMLHCSNL